MIQNSNSRRSKQIFFTDEKNFYFNPPISNQNNRVGSGGLKRDIDPRRLLVEREKFAPHVMVSAGVCFGGKSRLHFVEEKAKVNTTYYVEKLIPLLVNECKQLLPSGFILQQDGAPAHMARLTQDWLKTNCTDFIALDLFAIDPSWKEYCRQPRKGLSLSLSSNARDSTQLTQATFDQSLTCLSSLKCLKRSSFTSSCHTSRPTTLSLQYSLDSVRDILLRLFYFDSSRTFMGPSTVLNSLCWHFSMLAQHSTL